MIDFGRPAQLRVDSHVLLPLQSCMLECNFDEVPDGVTFARGNDEVLRSALLEHQPHRAHVIGGKAPVATCIEIPENNRISDPELDSRDRVADLAGDELETAPRRFMIE